MVNYLHVGDLNGARIEAQTPRGDATLHRRSRGAGASLIGPGSYLAGFIFEKSGQPQEALRYYDEALQFEAFESLSPGRRSARSAGELSYAPHSEDPRRRASSRRRAGGYGRVGRVVNHGRVPEKTAQRVPIGLALTYASGFISPDDAARANELAAQGLVTWVNYPTLAKSKTLRGAQVAVDGQSRPLELALAVDTEAEKAWDDAQGTLVASAITRMIARVLAGQVAKKAGGDSTVSIRDADAA